jgi:5-methyltetrahydrofolate--homocysteine methyltransferase
MEKAAVTTKGTVVLATVKGDVHDIGKNLVDIIFSNNGYRTVNLGIKQPISAIIDAAEEHRADVIGLSGLLVKSTLVMRDDLLELNDRGLDRYPVILGGAALTRTYVEADLRRLYKGRLFYAKDAFEGLRTLDTLQGGDPDPDFGRVPVTDRSVTPRGARETAPSAPGTRSDVATDNTVFVPPFLGTEVVKGIPVRDVARYLNETALFRNQWQIRPGGRAEDEYQALLDAEATPRLRALLDRCVAEGLLVPQIVYGYFPVQSAGDDIVVYDAAEPDARREVERFSFPRQPGDRHLCLADFVRPVGHDELDYMGLTLATVGQQATDEAQRLFAADRYRDYLELHGLSVEMAEALAEYWHARMRTEWGFPDEGDVSLASIFRQGYRGGRYSFGYPACPRLEDHEQLFRLLKPERVGMELTEEWQLVPEQSTSALVFHHPEAKYFIIR